MSRIGLRTLAAKLASDLEFKKKVLSGDEKALAGFDLSKGEREAVASARRRLTLATPAGQVNAEGPVAIWL